jgi:hypothetical protein
MPIKEQASETQQTGVAAIAPLRARIGKIFCREWRKLSKEAAMKPVFALFGLLVLIGLTYGCGRAPQLADDAAKVGAGLAGGLDEVAKVGAGIADNLDEAAKVGAGVADNLDEAAKVGAGLGNDVAQFSPALDDLVRTTTNQQIATLSGFTTDQRTAIENAIISTACEILLTSLEGGQITRDELIARIGSMVSGIFLDQAEGIDFILESADFLGGTLLDSGYDQGSLADYCDYLP